MSYPTLITSPASKPVSLSEAKAHLRVFDAVTDDDTLIQALIDAAIDALDGFSGELGRCIVTQTWSVNYSTWVSCMVSPFPDVSAAVVKYYDSDGVEQTVSSSLYEILFDGFIQFKDAFTYPTLDDDRAEPVTVEWTCGFSSVPDQIKLAIKMLVAHWYENREAVVPNERRVEMNIMPMAFRSIVAKYRTGFVVG